MEISFNDIYGIICILVGLYKFIVAILEIIFVIVYHNYHDMCYDVWNWIVASSIIDTISFIVCLGFIISIFKNNDNLIIWKLLQPLHLLNIIIAIWSACTYFKVKINGTDGCYEYWNTQSPKLWSFVLVHFAELWIGVIIIFLGCCCGLIYAGIIGLTKLIKE
jgi:hypothetical protein